MKCLKTNCNGSLQVTRTINPDGEYKSSYQDYLMENYGEYLDKKGVIVRVKKCVECGKTYLTEERITA